jgi:hypothetical protein
MNLTHLSRYALGLALAFTTHLASAQSTVGAVLDAGGKQLSKADLSALLGNVTLRNRNDQNARVTTVMKADGTLTGSGISSTAHEFIFKGDWQLADNNLVCFALLTQYGTGKHCEAIYKQGDKYFYASDPQGVIGRDHQVFERTVSKP